ncbi:MAG: hypothetical protein AAF433_02820 [Bacteroidota bacterium]
MQNWYVDIVRVHRKEHLLFTHSLSLYSLILYCRTPKEKKGLATLFQAKLAKALLEDFGLRGLQEIEKISGEVVVYTKTNSRAILGSMNDFKWQIAVAVAHHGIPAAEVDSLRYSINDCPMRLIDYSNGQAEMAKLLMK